GFTSEQYKTGLLTPVIGNTYSGSSPIGLAAILDEAAPGDRIFLCAYGSGAGADAFDITVTNELPRLHRAGTPTVQQLIADKEYVDYATYAKFRRSEERRVGAEGMGRWAAPPGRLTAVRFSDSGRRGMVGRRSVLLLQAD